MKINLPVPELNVLCDFVERNIELEGKYPETLKSALSFLSEVRHKDKSDFNLDDFTRDTPESAR